VFYAAPYLTFTRGTLDREPVRSAGLGVAIGVLVAAVALGLLCGLGVVVLPMLTDG